MRFLGNYLKDYKKESILAPLFKMLEAIFELLVPLVMASIIGMTDVSGTDSIATTSVAVMVPSLTWTTRFSSESGLTMRS